MTKRIWTDDQKKAINIKNRTILVSAAAGSGKTAVLSQRVINKITSKNNPCDVDRLLIVTFTNAAASEMKERISNLLSDMINKDPNDLNLIRQQSLLKNASICTIHSFCNNIVRENFYRLGISPNFRIADENEISILQEQAIKKVLDRFYESNDRNFLELVEMFSNEKDDSGLINIIIKLYSFVSSYPFYDKWFVEKKGAYKCNDISNTIWGKVLFDYIFDVLLYCEDLIQSAFDILEKNLDIKDKYIDALSIELSQINEIKELAKLKNWDGTINRIISFKRGRRKKLTEEYLDSYEVLYIENIRGYMKKSFERLKKYFCFYENRCIEDIKKISNIMDVLFEVTKLFISEFSLIKESKNLAEFSDLEKWMVSLLAEVDNYGNIYKSQAAEEISIQYDEVMVDEYQDTNETQDLIFKMVSQSEKNLFMVGDIKQSIYGFRKAMPEIFMKRKEKYKLYDEANNDTNVKIVLGKNFRSRKGIIDSVNFVFSKLMSKQVGNIEYNEEEKLIYGSSYKEKKNNDTILEIVELSDEEDMDTSEAIKISEIIADIIGKNYMVKDGENERSITYKDFCILLRSANKHAPVYAKELNDRGIPAWSDTAGKFFGTWEISNVLSFLRIIDNPVQDIPLLSVLMSPIFGFSPEDLSDIRLAGKNTPLYFAVKALSDKGDKKCIEFMAKIDKYRRLCSVLTVEKLINYIYDDTGYTSIVLAMNNGELRLANLRMLSEYAGKYDGTAYRGLSGFIGFIDKLQEKKSDLFAASTISETSNAVRIMSIHRSKGLEFPVCIIARCSGRFNKEKGDILFHTDLGPGIMLKDQNGILKYSNFIKNSISLEIEKEEIAEELRVLYVAMTRAKEKLIFLVSVKNLEGAIKNSIPVYPVDKNIPSYIVRNSSSFADWILKCILLSGNSNKLYDIAGIPNIYNPNLDLTSDWDINITRYSNSGELERCNNRSQKVLGLPDKFIRRFNFKYPHQGINHIPTKISASKLAHEGQWRNYIAISRPSFMSDLSVTPAEKGTAFHEFLHFVDYSISSDKVETQIDYLKGKGLLTTRQAEIISIKDAKLFLDGELGKRLRKSNKVLREYRFTVGVPARDINGESNELDNKEKVIIQGAIDCIFKEGAEYVIVDYKTDKVKCVEDLRERYSKQLFIYKYAFEICEEVRVKELLIYSIPLGIFIKL